MMNLEERGKHYEDVFCSSCLCNDRGLTLMSENHSSLWLTRFFLFLFCVPFYLISSTYFLLFSPSFSHSFLSICTFWSLGSNKRHTASFTLTGGQFRSQMTQRRLVRGYSSYLGPHCFHHGLSIHYIFLCLLLLC